MRYPQYRICHLRRRVSRGKAALDDVHGLPARMAPVMVRSDAGKEAEDALTA